MADKKELSPVQERFVLHWGEMGTKWGINRTVAQIHALLFISPRPLPAEEIADTLGVARSNVSTSLRELQGWGIVRRVHVMGDRRDHFDSLKEVWELFRTIAEERKKREVDPTVGVLRECLAESGKGKRADEYTELKLRELLHFFETTTGWYQQLRGWSPAALSKLASLGDKALKLLGIGPQ